MKLLITMLSLVVLFGSCTKNETYDIYLPGDGKQETIINEVKTKPASERNYSDFLQLAISYSEADENSSVIKYWLEKSFEDNKDKSCEILLFIKDKKSDWKIASNYSELTDSIMIKESCIRLE